MWTSQELLSALHRKKYQNGLRYCPTVKPLDQTTLRALWSFEQLTTPRTSRTTYIDSWSTSLVIVSWCPRMYKEDMMSLHWTNSPSGPPEGNKISSLATESYKFLAFLYTVWLLLVNNPQTVNRNSLLKSFARFSKSWTNRSLAVLQRLFPS